MIDLYDHIQELRSELRGCRFTRRERAAVEAELAKAVREQAERDRAFDEALAALDRAATPMGAAAQAALSQRPGRYEQRPPGRDVLCQTVRRPLCGRPLRRRLTPLYDRDIGERVSRVTFNRRSLQAIVLPIEIR